MHYLSAVSTWCFAGIVLHRREDKPTPLSRNIYKECRCKNVSQRTTRRHAEPTRKNAASTARQWLKSLPNLALGMVLVVGTVILYSPVRGHDFINYDDDRYVVNNSHVRMGLTWETVRWSISSREDDNWHPLTWWSHAADCEFFGLEPGWHHLMNVLIHSLNALLLFIVLSTATRLPGPSFVVAALFAWHPFNVESVAWIAERKNLLCTFFFLLTLAAYGWYALKPGTKRLAVVSAIFLLALAAKPMAVTLPLALLLVDCWPLRRVAGWTSPSPESSIPQQSISRLLVEKWPLFLMAVASSTVTLWAQSAEALRSTKAFPFSARIENAVYSFVLYVSKTFWPWRFALFYPHPGTSLPLAKAAWAGVILSAVSIAAWMQRRVRPYLIVGWLFFLGVLFPMIGAVQVGEQAMADRYAYLSIIGLFVMAVWGGLEGLDRLHAGKAVRRGLVAITFGVLWFLTFRQISYWQNSVTIWSHTLEVTNANLLAERKLAFALLAQGDNEAAEKHFIEAVNLDPKDVVSRVNLGVYYFAHDRLQDAIKEFEVAAALTKDYKNLSREEREHRCSALLDLGFVHLVLKDYPQALASLQAANQTDPLLVDRFKKTIDRSLANAASEDDYLKMSLLLRAQGRNEEALSLLQRAVSSDPEYSRAVELLYFLTANNN